MKKILLITLLLLVACSQQQTTQGSIEEVLTFGFIGPLTGEAAMYGEEDKNSLELAVKKINSEGGIAGKKVKIIYEDAKCSGKEAASAAQKLVHVDKVKIILGAGCSGETLAAAPIVEEAKVIMFSSVSTSPDVTNAGDFVFRNSPSDSDSASATARLAYRNGVEKISIVAENTDYAQAFKGVFITTFEALGGEVVAEENYSPGTTDFRTIVTKAISAEPDAFLIDPQGSLGGLLAQQLREMKYNGPIYGTIVLIGSEVLGKYGEYLEEMYFSDAAGLNPENENANAFMAAFEAEYGDRPAFDYYAGARYDSLFILKQAIEAVGEDPEAIRDYLYSFEGFDGVLGKNVRFDENGDVAGIIYEDKQIINGEVVVLG